MNDPDGMASDVSAPADLTGIVVGFDGSPTAEQALDWGASAAAAYGVPLTLLRARPDAEGEVVSLPIIGDGEPRLADDAEVPESFAEAIDLALSEVHRTHPEVDVRAVLHPDSPVDALLEASRTAEVLVIGSRGVEGFRGLLLGSTTMSVAPHAHCPVVVVYPPDEDTARAVREARHPNEVVVGHDGSEFADHALDFALAHATRVGVGVVVVVVHKSRHAETPAVVAEDSDDAVVVHVRERLALDEQSTVPVTVLLGRGRPAGVLVEEADGAVLAVVGARGRGGFAGLVMGSVGLQLLMHAECPVAVVHSPVEIA
jgi:nucleotide-binding universal stress UspA family protein